MKKSFVYRTLQIATAVAVYSAISVWASTNHVDSVTNTIININSFMVILGIALIFPYICFNVLGKLYTPPASRNSRRSSESSRSPFSQDDLNAIDTPQEPESMLYRGARYNPDDLKPTPNINENNPKTVKNPPNIKYRGANIESSSDDNSSESPDSFASERNSQKSAKPKERMKYRGSYID
ncbi:hypothetical protein [Pseudanabaena sp. UWO310]|uniref:hypothetical protein n=1 Tax=Pseudanabaena sp. UWO310 TaxID=2480795 RepID=UPI0011590332|nr:hypothetical protein [Pseudanabaena sp. UWO310]TYQ31972.1 hypothetical protein PseudUWO310_00340 [Pseudanabaena sp. UWO310]